MGRGLLRRNRRLAGGARDRDRRAQEVSIALAEGFDQAGTDIRSATEDLTRAASARRARHRVRRGGEQAVETFAIAAEAGLADIEQAVDDVFGGMKVSEAIVPVTAALTSINEAYTTMFESLRMIKQKKELQNALKNSESCDQLS